MDVDFPRDGRIGLSPGPAHAAHGRRRRASFFTCRRRVAREFPALSGRRSRQFLPDGRAQLHDRHLRDSADFDPGAHPREILADRTAFRPADPDEFFPEKAQKILACCPSNISPTRRCRSISASSTVHGAPRSRTQWLWVVALLVLAHFWWERACARITIHGG